MSVWRVTRSGGALTALVLLALCGCRQGTHVPKDVWSRQGTQAPKDIWSRPMPELTPVAARVPPARSTQRVPKPSPESAEEDPDLSPDGRYVLRVTRPAGAYSACFTAFTRRNSVVTRRCVSRKTFWALASDAVWLPDGRRWACLAAGEKSLSVLTFSLDPHVPVLQSRIGFPRGTLSWPDLMPSRLLGTTGPDRVLAFVATDRGLLEGKPRRVPLFEFSVGPSARLLRQITVTLPRGVDYWGTPALSADGKRLAWLLTDTEEALPTADSHAPEPHDRLLLALSDPDGGRMLPVGVVRQGGNSSRSRETVLPDGFPWLRWTRDGHGVAFTWRGESWTVPLN